MSNILDDLNPVGSAIEKVGGAIEKTGNALDELFTSDEERLRAKIEMERLRLEFDKAMSDARAAYQDELSKRHAADMQSDSRFSKLVRPVSLVSLLCLIGVLAVTDGNIGEFSISQSWVDLLETLAVTAFAFYFGGRSVEKIKK